MKILFADLDGVANGHRKHPDNPYCGILPECMWRLNRVIRATDCNLVITSAWRYMMFGEEPPMTLLGFEYMMRTHGLISFPDRRVIVGHTVADETVNDRGAQIMRWLTNYPWEIEAWAAVDDLPELDLHHHSDRLVRTDGAVGMTDADADLLIEILGGS